MPKDNTTEKDDATGGGKDSRGASEMDEESSSDADSSNELEPVRTKKGEPADNLRRRAEWFQKRSGGG